MKTIALELANNCRNIIKTTLMEVALDEFQINDISGNHNQPSNIQNVV